MAIIMGLALKDHGKAPTLKGLQRAAPAPTLQGPSAAMVLQGQASLPRYELAPAATAPCSASRGVGTSLSRLDAITSAKRATRPPM